MGGERAHHKQFSITGMNDDTVRHSKTNCLCGWCISHEVTLYRLCKFFEQSAECEVAVYIKHLRVKGISTNKVHSCADGNVGYICIFATARSAISQCEWILHYLFICMFNI